jgi:hypothetical protein
MDLAKHIDFAALMEPVALRLLGEPNPRLSKPPRELRFGNHDSVSVDCETGRFFDHENNIGGGVVDPVKHRLGCDHAAAVSWLRSQELLDSGREGGTPARPAAAAAGAPTTEPAKIVAECAYTDEKSAPLFQVIRYEPKEFRQRKRADNGEWTWRLGDVRRVIYHLPEITVAVGTPQAGDLLPS